MDEHGWRAGMTVGDLAQAIGVSIDGEENAAEVRQVIRRAVLESGDDDEAAVAALMRTALSSGALWRALLRVPGARMAPTSSTSACRQLRSRRSGAKHRIRAAKRVGRRGTALSLGGNGPAWVFVRSATRRDRPGDADAEPGGGTRGRS